MTLKEFLPLLKKVGPNAKGWIACCPAHDDKHPSLSVNEGEDGRILLKCHAGCPVESVVGALGLKMADLFPPNETKLPSPQRCVVAEYDYRDEHGQLLFQCVRFDPKDFSQRRPDPDHPGKWIWNLKGVSRVLYRLPELKAAIAAGNTIFIAEGEKDVEILSKHGFSATCNPLGAKPNGSSWRPEHTKTLRGCAKVVVIADKDETGRGHARAVASALVKVAKIVKLIELPAVNGAAVKDSHDFFAAGGTADQLLSLTEAAKQFVPEESRKEVHEQDQGGTKKAAHDNESARPVRKSAATLLVKLADDFAFFHDRQSRPFVRLHVNGHAEVWSVNSTQFRTSLAQIFYKRTQKAINRNALADAIATLAGRACFDGPEEPVFLRVAPHGGGILVDLCDPAWRVIEVTSAGWQILEESSVAFIRTGSMRPLPLPAPPSQGSMTPLWELLNVAADLRPLVAAALLNGFHPHGPYFIVNFVGEQGSAKSSAAKIQRMLIDPNENPLRSPPREERDLLAHAWNNWCVVLDNLSGLSPWLSDALCRLATGGGHSARQLYSDAEEFTLSVKRPVILNGIDDVATRPDLAERTLQIELDTIPDNCRMPEKELWDKFEAARPVIFAAILNGLVRALGELPHLKMKSLPRMADAALWATAGEPALGWPQGTFIRAYWQNLKEGATASLEAHPIGVAVRQLLEKVAAWEGDATELLKVLNASAPEDLRQARNWPKTPRVLSVSLRRLAQAFRRAGISLENSRGKQRMIRLCKLADFASPSSPASTTTIPSAPVDANDANDAGMQPLHSESPLIEEFA